MVHNIISNCAIAVKQNRRAPFLQNDQENLVYKRSGRSVMSRLESSMTNAQLSVVFRKNRQEKLKTCSYGASMRITRSVLFSEPDVISFHFPHNS